MEVRLNFSHPTHLSQLEGVPHDFYIPPSERQWNATAREDYLEFHSYIPDNLHFDADIEEPDVIVKGNDADIHICMNPKAGAKDGCLNAYMTETMLVSVPPPNKLWYFLGKGVDETLFDDWKGDLNGDIVSTGNNMFNRGHIYDLDTAKMLKDTFGERFVIYGRNKDENGGCDQFVKHEELADVLCNAAVFVNLAYNSVSPNTVLEAMAVGVPVASVRAFTIGDFITHGYDGLVTQKVSEDIVRLLDDYDLSERLGCNARKTVEGKYNLELFQHRWDNLLRIARRLKEGGVI